MTAIRFKNILSGWNIETMKKLGFRCRGLSGFKFIRLRRLNLRIFRRWSLAKRLHGFHSPQAKIFLVCHCHIEPAFHLHISQSTLSKYFVLKRFDFEEFPDE